MNTLTPRFFGPGEAYVCTRGGVYCRYPYVWGALWSHTGAHTYVGAGTDVGACTCCSGTGAGPCAHSGKCGMVSGHDNLHGVLR